MFNLNLKSEVVTLALMIRDAKSVVVASKDIKAYNSKGLSIVIHK